MKQKTLKQLKKGDIFALRCDREEPTLYVKDHFDRGSGRYAYHLYEDFNSEFFGKPEKRVYVSE